MFDYNFFGICICINSSLCAAPEQDIIFLVKINRTKTLFVELNDMRHESTEYKSFYEKFSQRRT